MIFFITAIGTDSGKTLASAIFCQALGADYWKPVQSGSPRDADTVKSLVTKEIIIHPETYFFKTPVSPHEAAKIEKQEIDLTQFNIPETDNDLIIEGAGGILVPLNENDLIADLITKLKIPVVLVINLYLGCINHSLLTLEALKRRNIPLAGIVFNGRKNSESEDIILKYANTRCLLRISKEAFVNQDTIQNYAHLLLNELNNEHLDRKR